MTLFFRGRRGAIGAVIGGLLCGGAIVGAAPFPPAPITLSDDAVLAKGRTAAFGMARAQAIAIVSGALGKPIEQGSHGDCGQGEVIGFAKFRSGFELSFVRGRLSGWTADAPGPKTSKGIGVGATIAALRRAYPDVEIDPGDEAHGGLGPSFGRDHGPNGWSDGTKPSSKVIGLFAGATCLAGI